MSASRFQKWLVSIPASKMDAIIKADGQAVIREIDLEGLEFHGTFACGKWES